MTLDTCELFFGIGAKPVPANSVKASEIHLMYLSMPMAWCEPVAPKTEARVDAVKAKLAPWLDEPYFEVVPKYLAMAEKRCMHRDEGVRLDEADRRVYCKACNKQIDPFEALLHYAASETRLLGTRRAIEQARQSELDRKAAEKARRPFVRAVTGFTAERDLTLKAEPIIGYTLDLECGHKKDCGPNRRPRRVTCHACKDAARKSGAGTRV
jgi:hypothetical protein